jgi:uncharacterized small protein (DUF1192 family)
MLFACENETEFEEEIVASDFVSEVEVVNGVLCFDSRSSIDELQKSIGSQTFDELSVWEDEIGFNSIEKRSAELMDEIECRADQFVSNGYTQQEVLAKYDSGELEELTSDIQAEIERLKLDYTKDENGIRLMRNPLRTQYSLRFMNENYEIVIADTLYQYSEDKIEMYPNFSEKLSGITVDPILIQRSIIKSDKTLKSLDQTSSKQLCYDTEVEGDGSHKLEASFVVERRIYQEPYCTSDCVKTTASANIYYQGYWHNWFGWHAGTYNVTVTGTFDSQYYTETGGYSPTINNVIGLYSQTSSPVKMLETDVVINADYRWFRFGNVDCFWVAMGGDWGCSFLQQNGTDGSEEEYGFSSSVWLWNTTY